MTSKEGGEYDTGNAPVSGRERKPFQYREEAWRGNGKGRGRVNDVGRSPGGIPEQWSGPLFLLKDSGRRPSSEDPCTNLGWAPGAQWAWCWTTPQRGAPGPEPGVPGALVGNAEGHWELRPSGLCGPLWGGEGAETVRRMAMPQGTGWDLGLLYEWELESHWGSSRKEKRWGPQAEAGPEGRPQLLWHGCSSGVNRATQAGTADFSTLGCENLEKRTGTGPPAEGRGQNAEREK